MPSCFAGRWTGESFGEFCTHTRDDPARLSVLFSPTHLPFFASSRKRGAFRFVIFLLLIYPPLPIVPWLALYICICPAFLCSLSPPLSESTASLCGLLVQRPPPPTPPPPPTLRSIFLCLLNVPVAPHPSHSQRTTWPYANIYPRLLFTPTLKCFVSDTIKRDLSVATAFT